MSFQDGISQGHSLGWQNMNSAAANNRKQFTMIIKIKPMPRCNMETLLFCNKGKLKTQRKKSALIPAHTNERWNYQPIVWSHVMFLILTVHCNKIMISNYI